MSRSPPIHLNLGISTRIELRSVDPPAEPIFVGATLTAGLEGVKEKWKFAIDRNSSAMFARERKEAGIDDLPGTLNEAIE